MSRIERNVARASDDNSVSRVVLHPRLARIYPTDPRSPKGPGPWVDLAETFVRPGYFRDACVEARASPDQRVNAPTIEGVTVGVIAY